ncbi:MAG: hypothetical protein RLZZ215_685 [Pseudomonadota bacterium]|jgi:hypothetical protein
MPVVYLDAHAQVSKLLDDMTHSFVRIVVTHDINMFQDENIQKIYSYDMLSCNRSLS